MTDGQAKQRLENLKQSTGNLKFKCITNRGNFAASLEGRSGNSNAIHQGGTPLCGPAAFMHCIAGDRPADYINYVLDLAETGTGRLGGLTVTPSSNCLNATFIETNPVDWVALATYTSSTISSGNLILSSDVRYGLVTSARGTCELWQLQLPV